MSTITQLITENKEWYRIGRTTERIRRYSYTQTVYHCALYYIDIDFIIYCNCFLVSCDARRTCRSRKFDFFFFFDFFYHFVLLDRCRRTISANRSRNNRVSSLRNNINYIYIIFHRFLCTAALLRILVYGAKIQR